MTELILYLIIVLGGINLLRVAIMLIATDIHDVVEHSAVKSSKKRWHNQPWLTVIIPAYNEELSIEASLKSIFKNKYKYYDVIVVDDGSSDNTSKIVQAYIDKHDNHVRYRLRLITQKNAGKAHALNAAIKKADGSLVMCLDADSLLGEDAIANTVKHFMRNERMVAMASNVHVTNVTSIIGLVQKFEYMLSYRLKRALNLLQSEYIIGGVGSTFRKDFLFEIGLYDTDTMTEDIDLTLKIVSQGNKEHQLGFGYDVHTYTQGVQRYSDLIKQRYRWKYGRMQAFLKNKHLFFNRDKKYSRVLTMFQLPYAVFGEFALLIEPIFLTFIVVGAVMYMNFFSILWILCFMIFYMGAIILNDLDTPLRTRLKLFAQIPLVWLLFYIVTFVELAALLKSIKNLKNLKSSMSGLNASSWEHVERVAM
jgi:biofilm PGA synthesis N-glycosyltransferase PgaC